MAFPLTGNQLAATGGVAQSSQPSVQTSATRSWAPPVVWSRVASVWLRVGIGPGW